MIDIPPQLNPPEHTRLPGSAAYVIIRCRSLDGFILFLLFTFAVGPGLSVIAGKPRFLLA